jgi:hypothetical protein
MLYRPILSQLLALNTSQGASDDLHSSFKHDGARACVRCSIQLINLVHETFRTETAEAWWWNSLCRYYDQIYMHGLIVVYRCLHRQPGAYDVPSLSLPMGHTGSIYRDRGIKQMPLGLRGHLFVQLVHSQVLQPTYQNAPNHHREATRLVLSIPV